MENIKDYKNGGSPKHSELFSEFLKVWGKVIETGDTEFIETCFKYSNELKSTLEKIDNATSLQALQFSREIKKNGKFGDISYCNHPLDMRISILDSTNFVCDKCKRVIRK